ncbi:MAG: GYD domain-containing protein [Betaproteobacteria bacterium]
MAKYMVLGNYHAQGAAGLIAQGGSARVNAIKALCKQIGGKLESCYFSFGDYDIVAVIEAPDNVSMTAASLAVAASGIVSMKTIVLLSPKEMDEAATKVPGYKPPGA